MMSETHYDAVVIGAGPVGCVAALAMKQIGLSTAVLEVQSEKSEISDGRTLALSWNSYLILNRLNIWSSNEEKFPISRIQISDRGHFGQSIVSASDVQLPKLGFVVRFKDLLPRLRKQLSQQQVKTLFEASANSIERYKAVSYTHLRAHET